MIRSRLQLALSRVLRSLWFRPALFAGAALAVALVAPSAGALLPDGLMRLVGLQGIYDLLTALAGTLLAVATFSLGIFAASLRAAAQAATPRVRPLLAEDPTARNAISTFIGGFVFAVAGIVILSTGYAGDAAKMLMFFVTCGLILALIVALVRWIGRLSRLGGVSEVIDLAEAAARRALRDLAAEPFLGGVPAAQPPRGAVPVEPPSPGFVQAVDMERLSALAEEWGLDLHLAARPGAFVGPGRPLALAPRPLTAGERRRLCARFVLGHRRTFEADPRFGLVALSEIASRALSPAVNDPGTAIDVVTASTRLLCDWAQEAQRELRPPRHPRLRVEAVSADDLVEDAFRWIARDAAGSAEVLLRLLQGLRMVAARDPVRLGPPARRLAREALGRAEAAPLLPSEIEPLRALVAEIERT